MKINSTLVLSSLFLSLVSFSQTGPGGVPTASNMLWMDANSGVTTSAGLVTQWVDRSANGFIATPNAPTNQPTFVAASVNTFPSFNFDGTDDELRIPDANPLDLTTWHIFMVVRADVLKNYNAWMVKGDDGQEDFEMLSYSDGNLHTPIYFTDLSRDAPSSAAGQVTTAGFNILEYSYVAANGRSSYKNSSAANIQTDNLGKTTLVNNLPVYIGNERSTVGRFVDGDEAEIIVFNGLLNAAQRNVVNNYLSSKYNIALGSLDFYSGDAAGSGNYDYDVAGLGQSSANGDYAAGDNTSVSSSITGGLEIVEAANTFGNGEYLMYGHQTGINGLNFADVGGMPIGPNNARWTRVWYLDWTHTGGAAETVNMTFDVSDSGINPLPSPSATTTDYKLLYRAAAPPGAWTVVMNATSIAGDRITFNAVSQATGDGYYTIGTLDNTLSPLPVELLTFNAIYNQGHVDLTWETASETNNDFFTIERSKDGIQFEDVMNVNGAGNSTVNISYLEKDLQPFEGLSYYRLRQTDFNGTKHFSGMVPVNYTIASDGFTLYPNPAIAGDEVNIKLDFPENQEILVVIRDMQGKEFYSKMLITSENNQLVAIDPEKRIAAGTYIIIATSENKIYSKRLIVK